MFNATPLVRDPLPLLTQNDYQKSSIHPPLPPVIDSISINFGETIRNWLGRPLSNLSSQKSPRIHPSRIEIFDRLIFHPDRGRGGWMRAQVCILDRCRQFCCIRWTVSSDREYIYIFFSFFLFSESRARFHSPSPPPPRVNLKRVRGKRGNASLFDPHEIRRDVEYEGGEGMIRDSIHRWFKGSTGQKGDRWWRSMVFFLSLFSFFFPLLEKRMKLKYIFYTRVWLSSM